MSSSDTHINHVNLHGDTIYTITPTIPNGLLDRAENAGGYAEEGGEQEVNSGWGYPESLEEGVALWTFCSFNLAIYETVSRLVESQEDYIWSGIGFLKTKKCAFRLLPISPLRFFCSRVAKCFHRGCWEGVSNFLSSLSLGDFLCVAACLLFVKEKMCWYARA